MNIIRNYLTIILVLVFFSLNSCVTMAPNVRNGKQSPTPVITTNSYIPLGQKSIEASTSQLELARDQGKAADAALAYLLQNNFGKEITAGPYRIAFCIEKPKGYYQVSDGKSEWVPPSGNAFISVIVRDGFDGRIIPELNIKISLESRLIGILNNQTIPFGWFPLLNRYGNNFDLPQKDDYNLKVEIDIPEFRREDYINGDRYPDAIKAGFDHLNFQIDQLKESVRSDNQSEWLPLAKAQGRAEQNALDTMMGQVAINGEEEQKGDYKVAYTYDYAKGYWDLNDGKLKYNTRISQSSLKNGRVSIVVMDELTGRFLPDLKISARFFHELNPVTDTNPKLVWHPWLYHYAQNIRISGGKTYSLRVHVDPPSYRIYGHDIGEIMDKPLDLSFQEVKVKTGQR